jgi:hypothetical protein
MGLCKILGAQIMRRPSVQIIGRARAWLPIGVYAYVHYALKLTYEHLQVKKNFLGSLAFAIKGKGGEGMGRKGRDKRQRGREKDQGEGEGEGEGEGVGEV